VVRRTIGPGDDRTTGPFRVSITFNRQGWADPDALVVCPATFNTINKVVAGASDNYALGAIARALSTSRRVLMAPLVSTKLWGHPVWQANLDALSTWGVAFIDVQTGASGTRPVPSGTGPDVSAGFEPNWIVAGLNQLN
jgi:phosphopantothenoylcysteine synthetase/decarboxylase